MEISLISAIVAYVYASLDHPEIPASVVPKCDHYILPVEVSDCLARLSTS